MPLRMKPVVAILLAALNAMGVSMLLLTSPSAAGEWKTQNFHGTKIGLQIDWPWVTPERGTYAERWNDSFRRHYSTATWHYYGNFPRVEIRVITPSPGIVWKRVVAEINEENLRWWNFFKRNEINDLSSLQCEGLACVQFKTLNNFHCGAFKFVAGQISTMDTDSGDDVVFGYYCENKTEKITTEQMNQLIQSIVIKN